MTHQKHFKFQSMMNMKYLDASNAFKPVNFVTMDKKIILAVSNTV